MAAKQNTALRRVWGAPVLLGVLTCFGLLAALLGVGVWHWLAWTALAAPVAAGVWFWMWPRR
ncbi:hypothetical protein [Pollutimonas harenae]|uniref:DUF4175 domain-containing protein n=1 Tax=Pollutimonas harenae TaxID=657015 RepID=A0A853GSQ8_9BURK|nr:hypothetical protein [Pollutimonas harenae]NYT85231.1 hypothetical protein [Pollutimonas harenae]TEA72398.1 hypothetical protein ERD84_00325 [Pollutimonas harenae]